MRWLRPTSLVSICCRRSRVPLFRSTKSSLVVRLSARLVLWVPLPLEGIRTPCPEEICTDPHARKGKVAVEVQPESSYQLCHCLPALARADFVRANHIRDPADRKTNMAQVL